MTKALSRPSLLLEFSFTLLFLSRTHLSHVMLMIIDNNHCFSLHCIHFMYFLSFVYYVNVNAFFSHFTSPQHSSWPLLAYLCSVSSWTGGFNDVEASSGHVHKQTRWFRPTIATRDQLHQRLPRARLEALSASRHLRHRHWQQVGLVRESLHWWCPYKVIFIASYYCSMESKVRAWRLDVVVRWLSNQSIDEQGLHGNYILFTKSNDSFN